MIFIFSKNAKMLNYYIFAIMSSIMTEKFYLYGKNPLKEAVLAKNRGQDFPITKLFLTKSTIENPEIMSIVQSNYLEYEIITSAEIENIVGKEAVHQGIFAHIDPKSLYTDLDLIIGKVDSSNKNAVFLLLDELQDPHNVGAIIRSAVAFGVDAILLPEYDQVQITSTVIKASSGMNFAIPIVKIGNINTTLIKLKEMKFWVYGLTEKGDTLLPKSKFDTNSIIVIGNESSGIRMKTLELCDFKVKIETSDLCESLNASNAVAITLYEWSNQQKKYD